MKWDYCCCAIPVLNVGAYATLSEQFVLGILVGTLSFATPTLVGSSIPFSGSNLILCGLGYAFALVQLFGFIGIFKEKAALFRRYVAINWIVLYAALSVAAALIGTSAARHDQAVESCEKSFFAEDSTSTQEDTKGEQICNIFCWVTVGVMGALWLILFIVQTYFVFVLRNYGVSQRADHTKYHSIYSAHDGGDNIMLNNVRSGTNGIDDDEWNARPSTDSWHPRGQNAYRDDDPGTYNPPPVHGQEPYKIPPGAQKSLPPDDPNMGYGVGIGAQGPSKQASVDDVYLEHPSKDGKQSMPTGANIYDDNPPSYHGHGSDEQGTAAGKAQQTKAPWQQQQPYNPYQQSGNKM